MTERREHPDDEMGLSVSPSFAEDLGAIFGPQGQVPEGIDRAVAEAAGASAAESRRVASDDRRGSPAEEGCSPTPEKR